MAGPEDGRAAVERFGDSASAKELRRNFLFFSLAFAVNHGVVTTPLLISTSVLNGGVGYIGNAMINVFTVLSSFAVAAPVVASLGLKGAVLFGMACYCAYVALFAAAAWLCREAYALQMGLFCLGSASGGVAAGVVWTAQGSYFARTVDLLARKEGTERARLTSTLAANFAVAYLGCEVASKLLWSCLDRLEVAGWITALVFTLTGTAATLLMTRALALSTIGPPATCPAKVKAAAALWADPVLVLISGINLAFGFSAAFMNGFINAHYTASELGRFAVPMLGALTGLTAAGCSRLFGIAAARVGKGPVVVAGAAAFFTIPFCFFALGCCGGWGWWLVVLYLCQGAGRAVYESTSKGVFADLFPHDPVGAFANSVLLTSSAFAASFFLGGVLTGPKLAAIALALSVCMPLGYFAAQRIRRAEARRKVAEEGRRAEEGRSQGRGGGA